jgi:hypothetical protein
VAATEGMQAIPFRDLQGRPLCYLNVFPSIQAMERLRDKIRVLTRSGYKASLLQTILEINEILRGWMC